MRRFVFLVVAGIFLLLPHTLYAQQGATWVVSWVASAHGPYPVGNPSAQPDQRFAFPSAQTGANDQTFRLMKRISGRRGNAREHWACVGWTCPTIPSGQVLGRCT
jgi:hypothetical protein